MNLVSKSCITAAAVLSLFNFSFANAMMLTGSVQSNQQIDAPGHYGEPTLALSNDSTHVQTSLRPKTLSASVYERAEQSAAKFQGHWKCITTVVASSVPTVTTGRKIQCDLMFKKMNNGEVMAAWMQNGWTPAQSTVGQCANGTLHLSHTSQFGRAWAAHSEDYARVISSTTMISTSIVDQYENGALIGRYKTQSQLIKIDG